MEHNKDAEWLEGMKNQLKVQYHDQQDITIDNRMLKQQLSKTSNWKTPCPDGIQGFWIKNLTALNTRIAVQLNDIASSGEMPEWMAIRWTVLQYVSKMSIVVT